MTAFNWPCAWTPCTTTATHILTGTNNNGRTYHAPVCDKHRAQLAQQLGDVDCTKIPPPPRDAA